MHEKIIYQILVYSNYMWHATPNFFISTAAANPFCWLMLILTN
jgi:hypothetical protein